MQNAVLWFSNTVTSVELTGCEPFALSLGTRSRFLIWACTASVRVQAPPIEPRASTQAGLH